MGDPSADADHPLLKEEQDAQVSISSFFFLFFYFIEVIQQLFCCWASGFYTHSLEIGYSSSIKPCLTRTIPTGWERNKGGCDHIAHPCCEQSAVSRFVLELMFFKMSRCFPS